MKKDRRRKTTMRVVMIALFLGFAYMISDQETTALTDDVRAATPGQFTELSQGVTHYEYADTGEGPVVVLVHGFSVPYYAWDPTFDALVDAGFNVLRYDQYGRGLSDRPEIEYDLDLSINQLDELLEDIDIHSPVHLVAFSQGGPIVASYANRYPDKVHSLVLIDPVIAQTTSGDIFPLNVPGVGDYIARVALFPFILPGSQVDDFYRPEMFPQWEEKYREQMKFMGFRRAILSSIRNLVDIDGLGIYEDVGKLGIPTLLIWGEEDQTISYEDVQSFLDVVPVVEFHPIPEAGHLPHYERPELVNPILMGFLESSQ